MRRTRLLVVCLVGAAVAAGCRSADEKTAVGPKHGATAAAELDKAKTETKEAAQAMKDYAYAERAEFVQKMDQELAETRQGMDQLSARVEKSKGAAVADAKTRLVAVQGKWAEAKKQLDGAEAATEATWGDVKAGARKSCGDLKASLDDTRQWLSDKIEP